MLSNCWYSYLTAQTQELGEFHDFQTLPNDIQESKDAKKSVYPDCF